jgi:hypothetical protein
MPRLKALDFSKKESFAESSSKIFTARSPYIESVPSSSRKENQSNSRMTERASIKVHKINFFESKPMQNYEKQKTAGQIRKKSPKHIQKTARKKTVVSSSMQERRPLDKKVSKP